MNMSTDLLSSFSRPEYPNDRNLGLFVCLRELNIVSKLRIKFGRESLVAIYAVQSDTKKVHFEKKISFWWASKGTERAWHGSWLKQNTFVICGR